MKIPRSLIGRDVKVRWRDPGGAKLRSRTKDGSDLPGGWGALGVWTMQGFILTIKDGVVTLVNSMGDDPPHEIVDWVRDYEVEFIPEALVESIVVKEDGQVFSADAKPAESREEATSS